MIGNKNIQRGLMAVLVSVTMVFPTGRMRERSGC